MIVKTGRKVGRQKVVWWRLIALVLISGLLLAAASGCSKNKANNQTNASSESKQTVELKLAHFWPATHPIETQLVQPWAKDIEKATQGRIKITSYPGKTLLEAEATYDGVKTGIADIGISCFSYTRGQFPVLEVFELPGITYTTSKSASMTAWEGIQKLNPKEVQDTKLLMVFTTGPGDLYSKEPVRKLEDLKGMEIRATGLSADTLKALGAVPVAMPQSEAYEALSKGVVKGNLGPDEILQGWKQAEVTKYITRTPFLYNTLFFVAMNKDKWNSLSAEDQKIILDITAKHFKNTAIGLWDMQNEAALKYAVGEKGMQVIELPEQEKQRWIQLVTPIQQSYVERINKMGLNGQKILDEVKALAEKYNKQYP